MDMENETPSERRCPICGSVVPAEARYCPTCGNRLPDSGTAQSFSAVLDDVLDNEPEPTEATSTAPTAPIPPFEPALPASEPASVWGPNEPQHRSTEPAPPPRIERPTEEPEALIAEPEPVTVSGPPPTAEPSAWSTTPGHWSGQAQPDLKQSGVKGNRTLWLVLAIIAALLACCCGFFALVSAISAGEATAIAGATVIAF